MNFLSICSGIEAASVAFGPLGWKALGFAEVDPACSWLLAHHYSSGRPEAMPDPDEDGISMKDRARRRAAIRAVRGLPQQPNGVPNLGDFSRIDATRFADADAIIGGTPCQSFSLAGKRRSLSDTRGNLALSFVELCHAVDAVRSAEGKPGLIAIWENVPGVLSTGDNAFGCFISGLVGCDVPCVSPLERGRWPDAGMVEGPRAKLAWRIPDAQYFGLAQRRERVLVVVCFRNRADPAAILFEPGGVRRNPPSRGKARQDAAQAAADRAAVGGEQIPEVSHALNASAGGDSGKGAHERTFIPEVAGTLGASRGGFKTTDLDQNGAYIPEVTGTFSPGAHPGSYNGQDAHNDLLISESVEPLPILEAGARTGTSTDDKRAGMGIGEAGDPMFTLQSGKQHAVFTRARNFADDGAVDETFSESEVSNALHTRSGSGNKAALVAEAPEAIGFDCKAGGNTSFAISDEQAGALRASHGGGHAAVAQPEAIGFSAKDHGADAQDELSPTLRSMGTRNRTAMAAASWPWRRGTSASAGCCRSNANACRVSPMATRWCRSPAARCRRTARAIGN
jgi:DNA (cytosine-5)-methyltransferase 1